VIAIGHFDKHVIPSEVKNGAAGEAATWTGRPEAERTGVSESNPVALPYGTATGSFDFAPTL